METVLDVLFRILVNGGILLGIFVILLLNSRGVRKTRANVFLSVLLVAFTFSIFHIGYAGKIIDYLGSHPYPAGDPTFLLITPLLWFYVNELMGRRVRLTPTTVAHFLPFLFVVICSTSIRSLPPGSLRTLLDDHPRLMLVIFWAIVVMQFGTYQYFIQRRWQAYQAMLHEEVSSTEDVNLSWVRFFTGVFLVLTIFFLASLAIAIHTHYAFLLWKVVGIAFSLSVFALGYKGIQQREIFFNTAAPKPNLAPPPGDKADEQLVQKVISYMEEKKPYLDPELSLSNLSQALGINRSQLSHIINNGIGSNFYDFVNKYRVNEVIRLMRAPHTRNFNLLGIALEAGFKSKSSFNLIFKRFTGLTPTEYKRNMTQ